MTRGQALVVLLGSAALLGCGSGGNTPADFVGIWQAVSGQSTPVCTPPPVAAAPPVFSTFFQRFAISAAGKFELTDVDEKGAQTDLCVYELAVSGNKASVKPAQACQITTPSYTSTSSYSEDVYALSSDMASLDEIGTLESTTQEGTAQATSCHVTFNYHYVRLP
jgi:hypothetical protein